MSSFSNLAIFLAVSFTVFVHCSCLKYTVSVRKANAIHKQNLVVVPGVKQCGGPGQLVEGRKSQYPILSAEKGLISEYDFVPHKDIHKLEVKIWTGINGGPQQVISEQSIPDSAVKAGTKYTVSMHFEPFPEFKGTAISSQTEIVDDDDKSTVVCAELYFSVI